MDYETRKGNSNIQRLIFSLQLSTLVLRTSSVAENLVMNKVIRRGQDGTPCSPRLSANETFSSLRPGLFALLRHSMGLVLHETRLVHTAAVAQ